MPPTVRPASEADLAALARIDSSYPTGPFLALERSAAAPEHTFTLRWRTREPGAAVAYDLSVGVLRQARSHADLFLVAEVDARPAGLLMIVVPPWTDAAEI